MGYLAIDSNINLVLFYIQAVKKYSKELEQDRIVAKHLDTLYQTMLEQNLCRIIEPYSRVQVSVNIFSC